MTSGVISKDRVVRYGEVLTPENIVGEMLDLVGHETGRIDSLFFEPGCGTGNFLLEILKRKLRVVEGWCVGNQLECEEYLILALSSLYGIELLEDNVEECRGRLFGELDETYKRILGKEMDERFRERIHRILKCNIVCGDALSMKTFGENSRLRTLQDRMLGSEGVAGFRSFAFHEPAKFDVIVGNPPYQGVCAGFGRSASPIYHRFVEMAKEMNPRYIVMIIPARWFAGGKGLDKFRLSMLGDNRIRKLVYFENASEVFPEVSIRGGVCYFLWERDYRGLCEVTCVRRGERDTWIRALNEFSVFVRHKQAISIIRKVLSKMEKNMSTQVTSRKPFGLPTNTQPMENGDIILHWRNGAGPYERKNVKKGLWMIDKWKVVVSYVGYDCEEKDGRRRVFSKIRVLPPGEICTETYLVVGVYETERQARNLASYMKTRFFRFLVSQLMCSHHITKKSLFFCTRSRYERRMD